MSSHYSLDAPWASAIFRLAEVLVSGLERFAAGFPRESRQLLEKLPHQVLDGWWDLSTVGVLTQEPNRALEPLLNELFNRRSLRERQPTESALLSVMKDLFSTVRLLLEEPWPALEYLPGAKRRRIRSTVIGIFSPAIFGPRGRTVLRDGALAAAYKAANNRVSGARRKLVLILEAPDESSAPQAAARGSDTLDSLAFEDTFSALPSLAYDISPADLSDGSADDPTSSLVRSVTVYSPPVALAGVDDRTQRVWYGTSRVPNMPLDEAQGYGSESDVRLHYGYCHVLVPRSHRIGSIGTSWIERILTCSDDDQLKMQGIFPLERGEFRVKLGADVALWPGERTGLVYVHGFNVTFRDAALLTAQLGCDLEVNGIASFFSWPSQGRIKAYVRDRETIDFPDTVRMFVDFIDTLLSTHKLDRLDIIAHSMGNRLLAKAIEQIRSIRSARSVVIGNIILAAADVSRVEFKPLASIYRDTVRNRVTLYICGKDKALWGSGKVNGYERVGFDPPPFCHDSLDTISVSDLRLGFLSHGYVTSSKPVIEDMKRLLWLNESPSARNLQQVPTSGIPDYWRIARRIAA